MDEEKYLKIPFSILTDENLTLIEKLVLAEIVTLDNKDGCTASNDYIAKVLGYKKRRVQDAIHRLKNKGYVNLEFVTPVSRIITPTKNCTPTQNCYSKNKSDIAENSIPFTQICYSKNEEAIAKNGSPPTENCTLPMQKSVSAIAKIGQTPTENCTQDNRDNKEIIIKSIEREEPPPLSEDVKKIYQDKIHPICNLQELDSLAEAVECHGIEAVIKAIQIAAKKGKRTLPYVEGILRQMAKDGYKELEVTNAGTNGNIGQEPLDEWAAQWG
ncbi:DnaD and phage-associated domain-containing protein [Anaerovibrio lipolyticus DSM 3074]|uniref:DnaD and phage-associated domain-containing protein n=1 Tax=Anaerovibrio lipolyticus DSM 3074 TaxID=1120997 RepID=A0A1M6C5U6_9FIRM|nr:helix-turn-helix domain-containing protein [Anaerovibrio lipolyticus]SHI56124.1 DnaD and phage-associated domain-containing protein [Anaerovibrio lipolyticus DSM 3074]